jgi:hypothetical protein
MDVNIVILSLNETGALPNQIGPSLELNDRRKGVTCM